jgi:hypothetical protein
MNNALRFLATVAESSTSDFFYSHAAYPFARSRLLASRIFDITIRNACRDRHSFANACP